MSYTASLVSKFTWLQVEMRIGPLAVACTRYQMSFRNTSLPETQVAAGWVGPSVLQPTLVKAMVASANTICALRTQSFATAAFPSGQGKPAFSQPSGIPFVFKSGSCPARI